MWNKIFIAIYLIACIVVVIYSYLKPAYNWDMLAYAGCVVAFEEPDKDEIHKKTYGALEESLGSKISLLIDINDYSKRMWQDSESFYQQLGFYKNRILYLGLVYALTKTGIPISLAMHAISIFFSLAIAIFFLFWLSKYLEMRYAAPISFLLYNIFGFIELSGIITPDALSSFIFIIIIYLIYEHKNTIPALILCIVSIFARPDNLITSLILASFLAFTNIEKIKINKSIFFLFTIIILLFYFALNKLTGSYGWWAVFSHTFIGKYYYPESQILDFSILKIIYAWLKGLYPFLSRPVFVFILLLFFYSYRIGIKYGGKRNIFRLKSLAGSYMMNIEQLLILVIILSIIVHYAIFPLIQDRFFVPFYLFTGLVIVKEIFHKTEFTNANKYEC